MIRYRLDELGWYQFEWLIQALLKSECGLAVEDWSASGGRFRKDAFCAHELAFPIEIFTDIRAFCFSKLNLWKMLMHLEQDPMLLYKRPLRKKIERIPKPNWPR